MDGRGRGSRIAPRRAPPPGPDPPGSREPSRPARHPDPSLNRTCCGQCCREYPRGLRQRRASDSSGCRQSGHIDGRASVRGRSAPRTSVRMCTAVMMDVVQQMLAKVMNCMKEKVAL